MIDKSAKDLGQILAKDIQTRASSADKQGVLPAKDIQALQESGYLALSVPKEFGGAGLSLHDCLDAQLELAQGSTSTALVAAMQLHHFGHARETQPWREDIFEHFCREAVKGALFNAAASEPVLGSPSRGGLPETYADYSDDKSKLIINGHKNWVTGGEHLSHLLVRLRLADEAKMLWIPNHQQGVRWEKTWGESLSLRASDSHDVFFEHVSVPVSHLIQNSTAKPSPQIWFVMLMAATYLGAALAARRDVIAYALERIPIALGKPIATLPKIQRQIGEMDIALQAAQTLLLAVAADWMGDEDGSQRQAHFARVTAAKHLATETALRVTDQALQIAGGASIGSDMALERYFRDVRAGLMHPPSGEAALEIVGQAAVNRN